MYSGELTIDWTHMGRRNSGIERITSELFGTESFPGLPIRPKRAGGESRLSIFAMQMFGLPWHMLRHSSDIMVFPGFPPSPLLRTFTERAVLYVHDLFLLTRKQDLNATGRYYMATCFAEALRNFRYFFANSLTTATELRKYIRPDAEILIYRPVVRNVFGLSADEHAALPAAGNTLRLAAVGTIEPRKNFPAAARIASALAEATGRSVELHVVGREGWGPDAHALKACPHVVLHGYVDDSAVRKILTQSDFLISSSHDEGLGLPLLEAQHGGLCVIAPDKPIFREVLGTSGILVDTDDARGAAGKIAAACASPDWRARRSKAALDNLTAWNAAAESDAANARAFLRLLLDKAGRA